MSVSFSGLASGLDTKSLVSSLVQVARAPATTSGDASSAKKKASGMNDVELRGFRYG